MHSLPGDRPTGNRHQTRSVVLGSNGMIATSQPLASAAGLEVLQNGGNAIDAAVTAAAVLGVVEPSMTGVGGDLFALVFDVATNTLRGLNASGRSAFSATPDAFVAHNLTRIPDTGVLSITVPGAVDGWCELLAAFGTIPLSDAIAPAIEYAANGYAVSEIISGQWRTSEAKLAADPLAAATFLSGGHAPRPGEIFRNPRLAATLATIAAEGRGGFYEGRIARAIAANLRQRGGLLDERDFAAHRADWVQPISTTYREHEIHELPPNTQGFVALEMLNILEGFDVRSMGHNSAEFLHLFVEAKRIAFADRAAYLADPDDVPAPVLAALVSKEYAAERRKAIDRTRAAGEYAAGATAGVAAGGLTEAKRNHSGLDRGDTVYLTAADRRGNVVSLIQSLFGSFGSGIVAGETGIVLQNRGSMFTLTPGHPNRIAPHKRPAHTLVPAFVMKDGAPYFSFGVMGGEHQAQGHAQVLVNLIDFGMNVQAAGEAARIHHADDVIEVERGVPAAAREELARKGHRVVDGSGVFGGYQGILRDSTTGVLMGGSDPRKDGLAIGY